MAIEKEEHEISKMLKNLGLILRYSIDKSNQIVTVARELEWLKQYIDLQLNRFNYAFECKVYVDDPVLGLKIHKLLFQPFIENAIVHGLQGIETGGRINIDIALVKNEFISILIEDNGRGMSKELVDRFNCRSSAVDGSVK